MLGKSTVSLVSLHGLGWRRICFVLLVANGFPGFAMPRARRTKKKNGVSKAKDAELMAVVLEGRHGVFAAEVADFFALLHRQLGDAGRSQAWGGVARTVRRREHDRLHVA